MRMDRIIILTTDSAAETFEDFEHNDTVFAFRRLTADGPPMLLEGAVWVFVDWVMPDLSGLEMCRRLRADPRTEDAHITMVLERDDPEDRRRALRAGADDYLVGSVGRQTILDRVLALHPSLGWRGAGHAIDAGQLGDPAELRLLEHRFPAQRHRPRRAHAVTAAVAAGRRRCRAVA